MSKQSTLFALGLLLGLLHSSSASAQVTFSEAPVDNQLYARSAGSGSATARIAGTVTDSQVDTLIVRHLVQGTLADSSIIEIGGPGTFEYLKDIPVALQAHTFTVTTWVDSVEALVYEAQNVVAGDVFVVQGQSNAVAREYLGSAAENESNWIRSFGTSEFTPSAVDDDTSWHLADGDSEYLPGSVGQLGIRFARRIVDTYSVPVAIINGGEGGKAIAHFQRNDADPDDLNTNYGRLMWRLQQAGIDDVVRAVIWYQGETDGSGQGDANTPPLVYKDRFTALRSDWQSDMSAISQIYVFQVRAGCGQPSPALRDVIRTFGDTWTNVKVMSTTGLDGHLQENNGLYCHWRYEQGYKQLGDRVFALAARDLYGSGVTQGIVPPNPQEAYFSRASRKEVTVVMRGPETLTFESGAHEDFSVSDASVSVTGGRASGNTVILTLSAPADASATITYADKPGIRPWVVNSNGVGLLTFTGLGIATRTDLPPDPPDLVAPSNGANGLPSPVLLDWAESVSATSYDVEVATDDQFLNKVLTASTSSTDQTFAPATSGTFYWHVRARNANGPSAWSPTQSFSVLFPPGPPSLQSPADQATDLSSSLTLQWAAGTDAQTYHVQVSTTQGFNTLVVDESDVAGTSLGIGPLATGSYFWRVRSKNVNGESDWTGTRSFSVLAAPGAPVLTSPENGATNVPPLVTLTWLETADALTYQIQVATDASFEPTIRDADKIEVTELQIGPLETGTYYWRVRGENPNGFSEWSAAFSFTVLDLPEQVTLVSPENEVTGLADTVSFAWNVAADAARYQLQISNSGNFLTSLFDNSELQNTALVVGPFSSGLFYWHVRALNLNGAGPWSETRSFSVTARPSTPSLVFPEDGEWNLPATLTLRWGELSDALTYEVQVATEDTFEEPLADFSDLEGTEVSVGPLEPGSYFWRVRASNPSGISDWSSVRRFQIVTAPAAPSPAEPADGAIGTISEPTLVWQPVENAASYQLSVSRNESFTSIVFTGLNLSGTEQTIGPLDIGTAYFWRVQARNAAGASPWSETFTFTVRNTTDLERDGQHVPGEFHLKAAYPNPFNPSTVVGFDLPERARVSLTVHDLHGRVVAELVAGEMAAGSYRATWDATGESSGVYFLRMQADRFVKTQKLVLLK